MILFLSLLLGKNLLKDFVDPNEKLNFPKQVKDRQGLLGVISLLNEFE